MTQLRRSLTLLTLLSFGTLGPIIQWAQADVAPTNPTPGLAMPNTAPSPALGVPLGTAPPPGLLNVQPPTVQPPFQEPSVQLGQSPSPSLDQTGPQQAGTAGNLPGNSPSLDLGTASAAPAPTASNLPGGQ